MIFYYLPCFFFYFLKEVYQLVNQPNDLKTLIVSHYKAYFIFIFSWLIISNTSKLYFINRQTGIVEIYKRLLVQILIFSIIVFAVSGLKSRDLLSFEYAMFFLFTLLVALFSFRFIISTYLKWYRFSGKNQLNVIFIDSNTNTKILIDILSRRKDYGYYIVENFTELKKLKISELEFYLVKNKIHKIFYSMEGNFPIEIQNQVDLICEKLHIPINFIPNSINKETTYLKLDYFETFPVFNYKNFHLDKWFNQLIKRVFDIVFSLLVVILIFSWLFPIIIILIYFDSGKPFFFLQKRSGYKGKEFNCFKFRTMVINAESDKIHTIKGDKRITKIGNFLRKTSLDELPQFFNVLKGDMSIVGPRPHMIVQNEYYSEIISDYHFRHYIKPGITGLAQIKGYRGEINSDLDMEKRIVADVYYIKNWSFLLDLVIIFKTILKTVKGDKNAI